MNKMKMNPQKYLGIFCGIWASLLALKIFLGLLCISQYALSLNLLINSVPVIIFFLYLKIGYKKKKNHWLIKTFIIIFVFYQIISLITILSYSVDPIQVLRQVCYLASFIVFLVGLFLGTEKPKTIGLTVVVLYTISFVMNMVGVIDKILNLPATAPAFRPENYFAYVIASDILNLISEIFFIIIIAVFWFCAVPHNRTTMAELELRELHKKYEAGKINEFVYQERKKQIIEKM